MNVLESAKVNGAKERINFLSHSRDVVPLLWGVALGLGVCAPFFGGRPLFLLDWSFGPIEKVVSGATLGLDGGLIAGNLPTLLIALLHHAFGPPVTWLPIFAFFPVASVGVARLIGVSRWAQIAAASLYTVNPFVLNRLFAGQIDLLLGYAVLPFAVASAMYSPSSRVLRWLAIPLWWGVLTALSPHFAWIYGVVLIAVALSNLLNKRLRWVHVLSWFVFAVSVFGALSAYIYLPTISTTLPTKVGATSLALYRTASDPHLGLYANVAALYGFWRLGPGPQMAKDVITGWPFLMAAILIIVGAGAWFAFRPKSPLDLSASDEAGDSSSVRVGFSSSPPQTHEKANFFDRSQLAFVLLVTGIFGYFLALGNQGPTGGFFTLAYDHLAFFNIMREPQKFLLLLALAYAVFFGWGVERLVRMYRAKNHAVFVAGALVVAVALPLGYTANMFDGLARQIVPSSIPSSYSQANLLMGNGDGNVLALPWHLYMSYPFTNNRVVANISPTVFNRNVISGDNVQSGGVESESTSRRSLYLEAVFAHGPHLRNFGALVAPLGVKFISLSKTVDWRSYDWLSDQHDLTRVLDTSSLEIWRNNAYFGVGQTVQHLTAVSTFRELLNISSTRALSGAVYGNPSSLRQQSESGTTKEVSLPKHKEDTVQQVSLVAYKIGPGAPSWVEVDAPYEKGWTLDGRSAVDSVEGTLLVHVDSKGGILIFSPWKSVRAGYVISGGVFVLCIMFLILSRRRGRTKPASSPPVKEN